MLPAVYFCLLIACRLFFWTFFFLNCDRGEILVCFFFFFFVLCLEYSPLSVYPFQSYSCSFLGENPCLLVKHRTAKLASQSSPALRFMKYILSCTLSMSASLHIQTHFQLAQFIVVCILHLLNLIFKFLSHAVHESMCSRVCVVQ